MADDCIELVAALRHAHEALRVLNRGLQAGLLSEAPEEVREQITAAVTAAGLRAGEALLRYEWQSGREVAALEDET